MKIRVPTAVASRSFLKHPVLAEEAILAMGRAAIRGLRENKIPSPDMGNKSRKYRDE